jgi:PAS domain S-box-containing protein
MRVPQVRQLDRGKGLYCLKKDGSEFPVDIALSPIGSERNSLIAASFRDVTERNAYEDMLKKNEARLQEAFRAGNMEAWELDAASGRVQSSLLLYEKFGYAAVKETNKDDPWLKAIHPEDRDRVSESLDAVRDGTQETYHETYRVYDANEGIRWIESTGKPLKNEQTQKVNSIVGIRMDITEQIESRNFLNEKLKELEEFNKLAVGRELRMIELKKEINELRSKLGISDRYEIVE